MDDQSNHFVEGSVYCTDNFFKFQFKLVRGAMVMAMLFLRKFQKDSPFSVSLHLHTYLLQTCPTTLWISTYY